MSKNFLISVVMPIYNSEKYLSASIESVIGQSLGFEKNIQLILVDDGSTDKSGDICRSYTEKYPDNIAYIKKSNGGASSARNEGFKSAEGKYVNFLDSDDIWEKDALEKLYDFLENNPETDVAVARRKLFDGSTGWHGLDYKFTSTGVIDLNTRTDIVQNDVTSALIRKDAAENIKFSEKLRYGEDGAFICSVLLQKCTLGIVKEAEHRFRMRTDGTSALSIEGSKDGYYFDSPVYYHKYLFDLSKEMYGEVKKFIQYTVMYDITWRVKKPVYELLPKEKAEKYKELLHDIMQDIEDDVIYHQRSIYMNMKMYCLSLKYGRDVRKELSYNDGKIIYKDFVTIDLEQAKTLLIWDYFELHGNILRLEGKDNCWMRGNDYNYYAKVGGEVYYPSYQDCPKFDLVTMEGHVNKGRAVIYEIHLNPKKEATINFFYRMGDNTREIYTSLGRFSHMPKIEGGYYAKGNYIVRADEKHITVTPFTTELRDELEENYRSKLLAQGKTEAVEWRKKYFDAIRNKKKDLWMISDRTYVANDNGEHFFRYMNKRHHKGIETCFNINSDCPDYDRMCRIGKVVPYGTDEYKLKFLMADKIISSSVSDYLFNPFGDDLKYLVDLLNYEFVFLQHGLTKDDLSGWLNRYNKNISLFITSAIPEYLSIVNGNYCMSKDIPVITGMPRYDALYRKNRHSHGKKKIVIMPTWRQSIKGSYDPKESKSIYYENFKETEYYKFYNSLINDERLLKVMRENGCTGLLCMHPMHLEQWKDFKGNDVFKVNEGAVDYQKEFISGSVLVTDYSSVSFDFAYLHKPVVYTQFDKEDFYKKHTYNKGYFDYERDGFGPVCYNIDSAVKELCDIIRSGFVCEEKYIKRTDEFYPYHDAHCCRRVYEAIRDLKLKYSIV